ncbi:MAG TPA: DUF6636 domain-containing protein [Thermoleophilaceae bacterium]|nr:DUF6636 domain-containing protein [Thermoleophilaceae bacterium]
MRLVAALATVLAALAAAAPASAATFFHSPSSNIRCVIDRTSLTRCDITERDWSPPPKPRGCPGDWGNGVEVGLRGRGRFTCAGDAVPGGRSLAYGDSIRRGRFECFSRRAGMRCVNHRNGHGFAVSRERARRF